MMVVLRDSQGVGLGYGEWGWGWRVEFDRLGRMGQRLSPLVHFKRPVGVARGVVKVCVRRKRGARFLYFESSPRLREACDCG